MVSLASLPQNCFQGSYAASVGYGHHNEHLMTRDSSEDWCDGISARAFVQPLVLEGAAGFSCRSQLQRNVHMHRSISSSRAAAFKAESRTGRSCLESVSPEAQPQRNATFIQSYTSQYNSSKRDAAKLRWTSAHSCSEYETRGGWCSPSSLVSETKIAPSSFFRVPRRRGCKVATLQSMAGPAGDRHSADELQTNSTVTTEQAQNESEWLRVALKQWLDDEYCPEPANEDISSRCGKVYYRCLLEGVDDIGDILIEFIRDLEGFSFKESFHGPFTAANAAVALIMKRMEGQDD